MLSANFPSRIKIVEVGPRDGLQNESIPIPTPIKVGFVNALARAGLSEVEVTSFVHPKWVPQLADAAEVLEAIERDAAVVYSALVPNEKGMERALLAGLDRISVFTAASESFNKKNINASIAESIERFKPVLSMARDSGIGVRGYVSTAFWCPYEGKIEPKAVTNVVEQLFDLGIEEISIGDTIGAAVPTEVNRLIDVLEERGSLENIAMHFHDTRGTALPNVLASLGRGISIYDSSAGGLGGCPYAPGASGNLATEDLVYFLDGLGLETGVDLEKVSRASDEIEHALGHALPSRVRKAGPFRPTPLP